MRYRKIKHDFHQLHAPLIMQNARAVKKSNHLSTCKTLNSAVLCKYAENSMFTLFKYKLNTSRIWKLKRLYFEALRLKFGTMSFGWPKNKSGRIPRVSGTQVSKHEVKLTLQAQNRHTP